MIPTDILLMCIGFIALSFASISDIKTREVPDWLSFSLIIMGLSIRLIHSIIFQNIWYFLYGLFGFAVMFSIGMIMYYTKQWGGGDAKIAMGIGTITVSTVFGIENNLIGFWINLLIFGALYGFLWSVYLALRKRKEFKKEFKKLFLKKKVFRRAASIFGLVVLVSIFFIPQNSLRFSLAIIALFLLLYSYLIIFIKAVENACMYRWLPVSKLTPGDWVAQPIYVNNKLICGPKDLGLEENQIKTLKKAKIKKVFIKEGIPFVPSFLLAAIATYVIGNPLFLI